MLPRTKAAFVFAAAALLVLSTQAATFAGEPPAPPTEKKSDPPAEKKAAPPEEKKAAPPEEKKAAPPAEQPAPPKPEKVKVPDVRNMNLETAKAEIEKAGLVLGTTSDAPGLGKPGLVFTQVPAPGAAADKGSKVSLKVGAPPLKVEVPKVVGLKEDAARTAIVGAKLKVGGVTQKIMEGKGGEVIEQTPAPGEKVDQGSGVSLVVGVEPKKLEVPELKGKTLMEAGKALSALGFEFQIVYKPDPGSAPGSVQGTEPAAGSLAVQGSTIQIVVTARGEPEFEVPSVTGKTRAEAEEMLKKAGFQAGKVEFAQPAGDQQDGSVVTQNPAAGAKVKAKGAVNLVVARSEKSAEPKMPAVTGMTLREAEQVLKAAGLAVAGTEMSPTDQAAPGTVIGQDPAAGTAITQGMNVRLKIAAEPGKLVEVPVILRKSLEEARKILADAGLTLGKVEYGKQYMKEMVLRQQPYPFKKVPPGTAIDVVVTKK